MAAGPVAEEGGDARRRSHWKLHRDIARLTQGLVVSGYGKLPTGVALFLEIAEGRRGGAWLQALQEVAPVTNAEPPQSTGEQASNHAVTLAFTWTGLQRMGLPKTALSSFSRSFREGMFQEDRLRRLGDRRGGVWRQTTGGDAPLWSANTPLRPSAGNPAGAYEVHDREAEELCTTELTVHALLLLYAYDEAAAAELEGQVRTSLEPHGVGVVHRRELFLDVEKRRGYSREHFGFADGLSQPEPFDESKAVTVDGEPVLAADPVHGVPLGEFLIGYRNGHHERAPGPFVPGTLDDGTEDGRPSAAELVPHPEAVGSYDFGLNGTYMVVRELQQDVAAFWRSMEANAEKIRKADPEHSGNVDSIWLAERVVGRDRDGNLLCPGGALPVDARGNPDNEFLFLERDPHGVGCPPGSHVRRANPRDALAPTLAQGSSLLDAANNHRILRRGRKYGPKIENDRVDDGVERGLMFMCLNTDIPRQFEFVQQTWLLNPDFATLSDEVDPLVGPDGRMTIRDQPLRRTVHVQTFVRMRGGDYFFLPSLPALRYLAAL